MKHRFATLAPSLIGFAFLFGCAAEQTSYAEYEGDEAETEAQFGAASQAVAACDGDDLQYDFNGFAASLAVAVANELGRWDVATDFTVSGGRLQLSTTGNARCGAGCDNVKALLALQDDATGSVPFHSPALFRSKLTGWYQLQMTKLTELATAAKLQPGAYRIRNANSNKLMSVDGGSMNDNAAIEQWDNIAQAGAGDWNVSVSGTKHKFTNARSGKCLDLASDVNAVNVGLVQRACSSSATQEFNVVKVEGGAYALMTRHPSKALATQNWSSSNDGRIVQDTWDSALQNRHWLLQPTSGGSAGSTLFKGMYTLKSRNSFKVLGVSDSNDNTLVRQMTSSTSNDAQQWYAYPAAGKFQFINRRTGKCMALASDSPSATVAQKTCSGSESQKFTVTAVGSADEYSLTTRYGKLLEIKNAQTVDGAVLQQITGPLDPHRRFVLTPMMAGEPHRLTYSHTTNDGPCGAYKWYSITEPNGQPLINPHESYIQLIFAGGKTSLSGADENPFIAQVVSGSQVAIDPSGYMLPKEDQSLGACIASDIFYDSTKAAAGTCCIRYNGVGGVFHKSSWSDTTFLCK